VNELERERDFYYGKLIDIEDICQKNDSDQNPALLRIMNILYAAQVSKT
jgi:hypothetical protein